MKTLSFKQWERARQFLLQKARPLERAQFAYEFENGAEEKVLEALSEFQNADGGFGRGLEPDLRCPHSSALATTVALQHLSKLKAANKEEMIADCMRYFANTYNSELNGWEIIPPEADEYPRAIWWNYAPHTATWGNPNAEIIAYLHQYAHLVPESFQAKAKSLLEDALHYLATTCARNEMHELFCYIRLAEVLSTEQRQNISREMTQFLQNCVIKQKHLRQGYCAVPLQVADSPLSLFYAQYEDVLSDDLAQLIEAQSENGDWGPNWSWGRYEEQWEAAKVEWAGVITLQNLRVLQAFDRIEAVK